MDATATVAPPVPNPWRTMWLSPRLTMRHLLAADLRPSWVPVVALAAISAAMASVSPDPETGDVTASRAAVPMVIGAARVVFGVLVGPFLLAWVGGWFGGESDPDDIRLAVAWSNVPFAATAVVWVLMLLVVGTRAFSPEAIEGTASALLAAVLLLALLVLAFWNLVLLVASLAEVQKLSIARVVVTLLILVVPALLLGVLG